LEEAFTAELSESEFRAFIAGYGTTDALLPLAADG
jgi:hypothetical protein